MSAGEEEEDWDDGDDSFVINVNMDVLSDVSEDAHNSANVGNYGRIFHFRKHRRERLAQCHIPFGNGGLAQTFPRERNVNMLYVLLVLTRQSMLGPNEHHCPQSQAAQKRGFSF